MSRRLVLASLFLVSTVSVAGASTDTGSARFEAPATAVAGDAAGAVAQDAASVHTAATTTPSATGVPPLNPVDDLMNQVWWAVFAMTTAAYVVVLLDLGLRRLHATDPAPSTWAPLDVPVAPQRAPQVRPHF